MTCVFCESSLSAFMRRIPFRIRFKDRSGLVVMSRLPEPRVPGSRFNSIEEPSCKWAQGTPYPPRPNALPLVWCENLERSASSDVALVI
ncbi:hypothetical protein AVEN_118347-1 [Araneus ventricosus]|uniref:Uncharacterized protein n=1 Tax=Araneus ventricosus TaxID=182803 RepID=A0A4Y2B5U2_ARAVE|nr:hypothetical protein AVEN_118347-1 [Araneus ventricosus]